MLLNIQRFLGFCCVDRETVFEVLKNRRAIIFRVQQSKKYCTLLLGLFYPKMKALQSFAISTAIYHCTWCNMLESLHLIIVLFYNPWARGDTGSWGTLLQARMSRVRFPMVSLEFFIVTILPGPEVEAVSNRHEYQEYFLGCKGGRCVNLTTLLPSCAEYLELLKLRHIGILWLCNRLAQELLYLYLYIL